VQKRSVNDAENGCIRANAQCQRKEDRKREAGASAKGPYGEMEIL
jgi:hypothetical protein